ncbi:hypothetical protein AVEN_271913-1 [Araneus ventricosus]|uniref:Uncharacterized protein n=1 Tax=Araneus ventricosus TaxID=182803 RepID=A0A4Y2CBQ0_ARAVE|nr:hypothetical protein AVEN_271913-1 [Araneus ventricosus]
MKPLRIYLFVGVREFLVPSEEELGRFSFLRSQNSKALRTQSVKETAMQRGLLSKDTVRGRKNAAFTTCSQFALKYHTVQQRMPRPTTFGRFYTGKGVSGNEIYERIYGVLC